MKVFLANCGNPDYGQNPYKKLLGTESHFYKEVDSFEQASKACLEYIKEFDLGGGNWSGGQIIENGQMIAYTSYNGRVWKSDDKYFAQEKKRYDKKYKRYEKKLV